MWDYRLLPRGSARDRPGGSLRLSDAGGRSIRASARRRNSANRRALDKRFVDPDKNLAILLHTNNIEYEDRQLLTLRRGSYVPRALRCRNRAGTLRVRPYAPTHRVRADPHGGGAALRMTSDMATTESLAAAMGARLSRMGSSHGAPILVALVALLCFARCGSEPAQERTVEDNARIAVRVRIHVKGPDIC